MGGLKWVILVNEVGWSGFYVNTGWIGLGWVVLKLILVQSRTLKLKSRIHTINFIKIDRNLLEMTQYDWQLLCAKQYGQTYMWDPCEELDSGIKISRSHYKILSNLTEIYWK